MFSALQRGIGNKPINKAYVSVNPNNRKSASKPKIFENINPDVIFEEMPPSSFEDRYILKNHKSLETVAIDRYTSKYKTPHIGVDLEDISPDFFSFEYRLMYEKIERLNDINGYTLRNSMNANTINSREGGFEYLNSSECQELYDNVRNAIKNGVKELNKERLSEVLMSWNAIYDKRENEMIKNIYSYCRENSFNQAVFTIGAAHSTTLLNKISQYDKTENMKLRWNCYRKNAST